MGLRYAYNTNGCANHRLDDALELIAEAGYDGVALTVDWHHFDPYAVDFHHHAATLQKQLSERSLGLVVETGARFLLDPWRKHEPTLISPEAAGRARRIDLLKRCCDLCLACGGEAVSFWSGVAQRGIEDAAAWSYLVEGVDEVVRHARSRGVTVAIEPEPGMLVTTLDHWASLQAVVPEITLALDLGHCLVTDERDPAGAVREFAPHLGTVSIEDMKRGRHEHLPFGQGDMDVPGVLRALREINYQKLVCVELSRESHRAHEAIPEAIAHLRAAEASLGLE